MSLSLRVGTLLEEEEEEARDAVVHTHSTLTTSPLPTIHTVLPQAPMSAYWR